MGVTIGSPEWLLRVLDRRSRPSPRRVSPAEPFPPDGSEHRLGYEQASGRSVQNGRPMTLTESGRFRFGVARDFVMPRGSGSYLIEHSGALLKVTFVRLQRLSSV